MSSYTPANYIKYGANYLIPIFNNQNYPDSGDTYKAKSYYQNIYNSAQINYSGTNCVYLGVSMTLSKGLWNVSYNANINLYSDHTTVLLLSTSDPNQSNSTKLNNRLLISQTCHNTNHNTTNRMDRRLAHWGGVVNVDSNTTYYLYGYITVSAPDPTPIYTPSITGTTADPDCHIILTAIPLN